MTGRARGLRGRLREVALAGLAERGAEAWDGGVGAAGGAGIGRDDLLAVEVVVACLEVLVVGWEALAAGWDALVAG